MRQYGPIVLNYNYFQKLPELAAELCVLGSVSSWEAAHERGQFYLQTAHPANPAFLAETPNIGAVVALELGGQGKLLPFLAPNGGREHGASFLGGRYEPMIAPANLGGLATIRHNLYGNSSPARFEERYRMLQELEAGIRAAPFDLAMANQASFYDAARQLMYDPAVSAVFEFIAEESNRYVPCRHFDFPGYPVPLGERPVAQGRPNRRPRAAGHTDPGLVGLLAGSRRAVYMRLGYQDAEQFAAYDGVRWSPVVTTGDRTSFGKTIQWSHYGGAGMVATCWSCSRSPKATPASGSGINWTRPSTRPVRCSSRRRPRPRPRR